MVLRRDQEIVELALSECSLGEGGDQDLVERAAMAVRLIEQCGGVDGSHHKDWVLDQVCRILTETGYDQLVLRATGGDPEEWETGVAP